MSFLNKLRGIIGDAQQKRREAETEALADLLRALDKQMQDAAIHLQDAAEEEAGTTKRGYLDMDLIDLKGRALETPPGRLEADDIRALSGYRALSTQADDLGFTLRLNEELIHTMTENENDDMAYRKWSIRVEGWGLA